METIEVSRVCQDSALLLLGAFLGMTGQHGFRPLEKGWGNVAPFGVCYSPLSHATVGIEDLSARFGCALMLA